MDDNTAYPGNAALPKEARDKILSTFRHSLNLYKTGKMDDCAVGCDFILKMDPRFAPARQLLDKMKNPAAPVDVAALEALVAQTATTQEKMSAVAPDKLLIEAIEAYAARDFDRAMLHAEKILTVLPGNGDAKEILDKARRKKEAQPHVENFRQRALFALEQGQPDEARRNLEMMRSLDPEHPAIESLAQKLGPATAPPSSPPSAPAPAPGFSPTFSPPGPPVPPPPPSFFAPAEPEPPGDAPFSPGAPSGGAPMSFDWSEPPLPIPPAPPAPPTPAAADFSDLWTSPAPQSAPVFSPPPPPPPAPTPPAPEVERLLKEGDELMARGNPQAAIETWSRVFLIDLNSAAATTRIEKARSGLAEANRRVAEALKVGRAFYESGKTKEAREKFLEVLALDEHEPTARSFLNRIEEDLSRPTSSYDLSGRSGGDVLAEEELAPAPPERERRAPALPAEEEAGPAPRRSPVMLIVAVLLVATIVAGVFFVLRSRSPRPPPVSPVPSAQSSPIAQAQQLIAAGKTDEARDLLTKVPASDRQYAAAQKMLSTLDGSPATGTAASSSSIAVTIPAANATAKRAEAEAAFGAHRYIDALAAFNQCVAFFPDDPVFRQEMAKAGEKVQEISPAVKLYNEGDFDTALPILWRLNQEDKDNADVRSYLIRGYYNQGILALQANQFSKAATSFGEAVGLDPNDGTARRQKEFADRYASKSPDLLARIYLKYLRTRP
jgi:tetratricopeptide (TPR) repeat protein